MIRTIFPGVILTQLGLSVSVSLSVEQFVCEDLRMRICIIGAGAAGLASARQATQEKYKHEVIVFEQAGEVGGTWVYSDRVGRDEFGIPVHSSMYKNLRTNLPKEVMGFPDYKIPDYEESYITQAQILAFLNSYTDHFNLRQLIQFYHLVKYVEPEGSVWKVTVKDLQNKIDKEYEFDAIMICNGHYHTPKYPQIMGQNIFRGKQTHSHDFRDIKDLKDQKVLVIGAGPSGMDIALQIAATAKEVYLSHHCKEEIKTKFPDNLKQKPDVLSLTQDEVVFKDKSRVNVDVIMYCTGYMYSFPFLDEKSGISVDDNHVSPLYKHLININNPTMCFIGLPFYVCAFSMFDLQARFFFEYLQGNFELPSEADMFKELHVYMSELYANGFNKKHAHMMGPKQGEYYEELAEMAKITPIPPVLTKLHNKSSERFNEDLVNFRKEIFRIVDDNNFVRLK